jgi:hypothetical protein
MKLLELNKKLEDMSDDELLSLAFECVNEMNNTWDEIAVEIEEGKKKDGIK